MVSVSDAFGGYIGVLSIVGFFILIAERISICELKVNVSFID